VAVAVAAGGMAGFALVSAGHHSPRTGAVPASGGSVRVTSQASNGDATPGQPESAPSSNPSDPSSSPSPAASGVGQVTIAADVSQDADASAVATFVNQYFTAINNHDYESYVSLLNPQSAQALTQEQFDSGYASTVDSAETLRGISTAANGDLVAYVTFTSRQNTAQSANGAESCTNWDISLFLEQDGGGYLIDQPPPSYHASYHGCQ